jgi:hypothetical protein
MKHSTPHSDPFLQDRYGRAVAARLSEAADTLPYDISERLRAAREQALDLHRSFKPAEQANVIAQGGAASLSLGGGDGGLWHRLAGLVPLLLLIAGLIAVNLLDDEFLAQDLAEIDAAILTDDLPPAAYTDPGFVQFLKSRLEQNQ